MSAHIVASSAIRLSYWCRNPEAEQVKEGEEAEGPTSRVPFTTTYGRFRVLEPIP